MREHEFRYGNGFYSLSEALSVISRFLYHSYLRSLNPGPSSDRNEKEVRGEWVRIEGKVNGVRITVFIPPTSCPLSHSFPVIGNSARTTVRFLGALNVREVSEPGVEGNKRRVPAKVRRRYPSLSPHISFHSDGNSVTRRRVGMKERWGEENGPWTMRLRRWKEREGS